MSASGQGFEDPHGQVEAEQIELHGNRVSFLRAGGGRGRRAARQTAVVHALRIPAAWMTAPGERRRYQWTPRIRYANASCWFDACSSVEVPRRAAAPASFDPPPEPPFAALESGNMW